MISHHEINNDFLLIIEKSQELVFFISDKGEIVYGSAAAEKLFGYTNQEYTQLNICNIIHPEDFPAFEAQMKQLTACPNITFSYQLRGITKTGEYRWIEGRLLDTANENDHSKFILKFQDVTDRKAEEEEKQSHIHELTKKNQELNQFVYIISHNLRTPVSNLIGLINIFNTDLLDDYNKGIINLFKSAADRLNETIVDLAHILSLKEKQEVEITRINFEELFEKVCSTFNEQIAQLGVTLITSFNCSHVSFNRSYMESILTNLLSNAIKYREPKRLLEIYINLYIDENQNCVLTFKDNGIGMDMDTNKDELFGLHQRFHNHINGNGVGLFITKSQITSLGGNIDVSSKVNEGTTFKITFKEP